MISKRKSPVSSVAYCIDTSIQCFMIKRHAKGQHISLRCQVMVTDIKGSRMNWSRAVRSWRFVLAKAEVEAWTAKKRGTQWTRGQALSSQHMLKEKNQNTSIRKGLEADGKCKVQEIGEMRIWSKGVTESDSEENMCLSQTAKGRVHNLHCCRARKNKQNRDNIATANIVAGTEELSNPETFPR